MAHHRVDCEGLKEETRLGGLLPQANRRETIFGVFFQSSIHHKKTSQEYIFRMFPAFFLQGLDKVRRATKFISAFCISLD